MPVLVVVSSAPDRDGWRVALEEHGHQTILVSTAAAAVDKLREGGVDMLVVDYDVAGGIGSLVRGLERLPDAPPFVLISGAVDAPVVSARLGAAGFVPKPCSADDLAVVVTRIARPPMTMPLDEAPTRPLGRKRRRPAARER